MAKRPRVFIVATESSGDNYGALLARELREMRPDIELYGLGGGRMESAGVTLFRNMLEHSAVGLVEVVRSLRYFLAEPFIKSAYHIAYNGRYTSL